MQFQSNRAKGTPVETYDLWPFVADKTLKDIFISYRLSLAGSKIEQSRKPCENGSGIAIYPFDIHLAQSKENFQLKSGGVIQYRQVLET